MFFQIKRVSILARWHLYTNIICLALGLVTSGSGVVTLFITVFKRISDDMKTKYDGLYLALK